MTQLVQATKNDIPLIVEFMEAFNAIDDYAFDRDQTKANVKTFLSNKELGRLWLVQSEGASIGYVALCFGFSFEYGGRDAFLDELYLVEDSRNKGHGKQIMQLIEAEAAKLNVHAIHLEVEPHNVKGRSVYLKSGYTSSDRGLMTKRLL